uniref:Uncharacterized protein n=1 Tax=Ciona savignyi TaxID=51511 RepID=H2YI16_CIOSA
MSQGTVTDYFPQRRTRGSVQASKRLKIADSLQPDLKELKTTESQKPNTRSRNKEPNEKRVTRSTMRKLSKTPKTLKEYFSPPVPPRVDCSNSIVTVTTAADDNHDVPVSPSKRKNNDPDQSPVKRGRVTPKKGFEFEAPMSNIGTEFASSRPTRKTARKRLALNDDVIIKSCDVTTKSSDVTAENTNVITNKDCKVAVSNNESANTTRKEKFDSNSQKDLNVKLKSSKKKQVNSTEIEQSNSQAEITENPKKLKTRKAKQTEKTLKI